MDEIIALFVLVCLATSAMSLTVSKAKVFNGVREWLNARVPMVGALMGCPYCLSHWFAFGLVIACGLYDDKPWLSVPVIAFAVIAVAAIITGIIIRLLMIHEAENERLREALKEARAVLKEVAGN